jgi:hypothetical protein
MKRIKLIVTGFDPKNIEALCSYPITNESAINA